MTRISNAAISALGERAVKFFRTYRAAGMKAVEDAARTHDDVIDVTVTQSAGYVAGSWDSKFGSRDARNAMYELAAFVAVSALVLLSAWGMWLAWFHLGFETILSSAATIVAIAILAMFSLVSAVFLATGGWQVPCKVCLAISLWTRGWTPVSMEWFGADAGATWALGGKNLYIWQKPFHGWDNPGLRVIRYQDINLMVRPEDSQNFLALSLDFELPEPRTEWLRSPEAANGMTGEQLAREIIERARLAGRDVTLHKRKPEEESKEEGNIFVLHPPIRPHKACWRLIH